MHAVAAGLSPHAAARVFNLSEGTVRSWITRAGQHAHRLHNRFLRALPLTHVQLDELRLKVRGATEATWLWVACDARTKVIPAFTLGPRSQALAHPLVHPAPLRFGDYSELAQRLAPGCLLVFSSDGLTLYFHTLTAHFGAWVHTIGEHRRAWTANVQLLYAQVIKRYRRRHVAEVRQHALRGLGTPDEYRQALRAAGFSDRIQTAFIERLRLRRDDLSINRRTGAAFVECGAFAG